MTPRYGGGMRRSVDVLGDMKHVMDQESRTGRWAWRYDILKHNGDDLTAGGPIHMCILLLSVRPQEAASAASLRAVNLHAGARRVCILSIECATDIVVYLSLLSKLLPPAFTRPAISHTSPSYKLPQIRNIIVAAPPARVTVTSCVVVLSCRVSPRKEGAF